MVPGGTGICGFSFEAIGHNARQAKPALGRQHLRELFGGHFHYRASGGIVGAKPARPFPAARF